MFDVSIVFCASILIWVMLGGVFILWVVNGKITREVAVHALVSAVFAYALAEMIKSFFPVPRPFLQNGISALVLVNPADASFPSGHAAAAFAMAVTIWLHNKKWGLVYFLLAFLVGLARILGYVHTPLDVIVGALLGAFAAIAIGKTHFFRVTSHA